MMTFAVVQHLGKKTIIHGIGETEHDAMEDALTYCESITGLYMALCKPFDLDPKDDISRAFPKLTVLEQWVIE